MVYCFFFFFKQKTAYELRISDWSSDVCCSDLAAPRFVNLADPAQHRDPVPAALPVPDHVIARVADRLLGEFLLRRLQFLQHKDVGLGKRQPLQQHRQPAIDPVHIIGRDLHRSGSSWLARPQSCSTFEPARFSSALASVIWKCDGLSIVSISFQVIGAATGAPSRARAL